jgi:hypothetical protein
LERQRRVQIEVQRESQDVTDKFISQQLDHLIETVHRELRLVDAFGQSVGPETKESQNAYNNIPNQEDIDHGIW